MCRMLPNILIIVVLYLNAASAWAQQFITVASTTSTEQSGLFKHILPVFEKKTGIQVRVVALGTGQALDMARRERRPATAGASRRSPRQ